MKKIVIDGKKLESMEAVHEFLKDELGLPDYYGKNLDALYDCLTVLPFDIEVSFLNIDELMEHTGWRAMVLKDVFSDASNENEHIRFII